MSDAPNWSERRLHLIGIGGVGMSGLAAVAAQLGATVSGSDRADGDRLERLRELGIQAIVGHDPDNVPDDAEVVYSSAVPEDNAERERGRELGLRELHRGELLAELCAMRRCIAVAGTHGKTTTAAMVVDGLRGSGRRPGYVIGGDSLSTGTNADWGDDPWLVVEADESDRSFLALEPDVAVVTNVGHDHHRTYATGEDVEDAFREFLDGVPRAVIPNRREVAALGSGELIRFEAGKVTLDDGAPRFRWHDLEISLSVIGEHNAANAAAALEAARLAGADPEGAVAGVASFPGVAGRMEQLGRTTAGADLYRDLANHPTEVRATLAAAAALAPKRIVAVLQPFNYPRLRFMGEEMGEALASADLAVVMDLHSTRGRPEGDDALSARLVVDSAHVAGAAQAVWGGDIDETERLLRRELRSGDLCVTLGSGGVAELAGRLAA